MFNIEHQGMVAGSMSIWTNIDSQNPSIRKKSELIIRKECEWAAHLGLMSVIFTLPAAPISNFARVLNQSISILSYPAVSLIIWIQYHFNI